MTLCEQGVATPVVVDVVGVVVDVDVVVCACANDDVRPSAEIDVKTRPIRDNRGMALAPFSIAHAIRGSLALRGVNGGSPFADQPRWQRDPTPPSPRLTK
ncbi:MAG TPA: hypothetical protein VK762_04575 [Polyangiaceae bacterium]|nr:hypothetical protein [Polyangiaceae bacterium]